MNPQNLSADPVAPAVRPLTHLGRIKRSYAPAPDHADPSASNDAAFVGAPWQDGELAAIARRTAGASGFGDAVVATAVPPIPFDATHAALAARAQRYATLAEVIAAIFAALAVSARRAIAAWRRARDERATVQALRHLDSRTLRDLGLDASEVGSVAAELAGGVERTRVSALMTLRYLTI